MLLSPAIITLEPNGFVVEENQAIMRYVLRSGSNSYNPLEGFSGP